MSLVDLQRQVLLVECCQELVDMPYVVGNIIGEDGEIVQVDEVGLPYIRRKYNVQRALEESGGGREL